MIAFSRKPDIAIYKLWRNSHLFQLLSRVPCMMLMRSTTTYMVEGPLFDSWPSSPQTSDSSVLQGMIQRSIWTSCLTCCSGVQQGASSCAAACHDNAGYTTTNPSSRPLQPDIIVKRLNRHIRRQNQYTCLRVIRSAATGTLPDTTTACKTSRPDRPLYHSLQHGRIRSLWAARPTIK